MIIDIHVHLWKGNYLKNKEDIVKACGLYNIAKVYVSGLGGLYPDKDEIDELNFMVYGFMTEKPEYVGGFCYINPVNGNRMDVLQRGIEEFGMSGMKLWVATFCDDPLVFPLVEKCMDYHIPIIVHAFYKVNGQLDFESTGQNVANLASRYPEAKIIMAHLGGNCYHGIKAVRNCKNVWTDISGSVFRREDIDYTKRQIGAGRILFGTDMPGASFLTNFGQVEGAELTEQERELIYFRNALNIFDNHLYLQPNK